MPHLRTSIHRVLALAAATAVAAPALAQERPAAAAATGQEMDTVIVTGSRIASDFASDSPIVSVSADSIAQTGSTSLEQVLNQLPQFVPSITTTSNNPSNGGQANIDLRGLGPQRNLVLLNGRRLPPSNSTGIVDVNIVPAALIDRIEVVSGGASAVYGSDAIAGVTNFVLKKNFEGVALQSGYSETGQSDGTEWMSSFTLGSNFGENRGNAVFNIQYTSRDQILQGDRDFSQVSLAVSRQGNSALGSGTIIEGRYDLDNNNLHSQAAMDQVFGQYGAAAGSVPRGQSVGFNPDGSLFSIGTGDPNSVVNFGGDKSGAGFNPDQFSYNFAPSNALSLPVKRWNLAGFANLDMSEHVTAYLQTFLTTYDVNTQIAPVPATGLTIPVTNRFIPDDLRTLLDSRPNPTAPFSFRQRMEGVGPRVTEYDYTVYQLLGGVRGKVGESWNWDFYAATSQVRENEVNKNDVSVTLMQQLLNTSAAGDTDLCAGGYNPFAGLSGLSADCADFLRSYYTNRTSLEHQLAEATFGGKAFSLPAGDAQFSIGAGWRKESFDFAPDNAIAHGDSAGFLQQQALAGSFNMKELFGELYLPVLTDAPFAKNLGFTLGARFSDHSISGNADAYKVEGTWQPIDALRVRTSYQRAVRAPSISELFSPPVQNFPSLVEDPCSANSFARTDGPNPAGVRALCLAQGIPASVIDSFRSGATSQVETFAGGNQDLQEETANTWTFGFVFSPQGGGAFENLHASLDYYDIKLKNAIFSIPAGEVVLLCYGFAGNNPNLDANDPACQAINRLTDSRGHPSDGTPWVPSQGTSNVSQLNTSGVDLQVDWGLGLGKAGSLDLNLLGTWLQKWDVTYLPTIAAIEYDGTIGDTVGSALPDYKLFLNARWHRGPFGIGARARYLPAMANKYASYDSVTTVGVPAVTYLDMNASWAFSDAVDLHVGVENLTDKQPPLYSASIQMNTDPSTYDVLGRRYYLRANLNF
jgi:outer membrane receptor protein involved in Fe transport